MNAPILISKDDWETSNEWICTSPNKRNNKNKNDKNNEKLLEFHSIRQFFGTAFCGRISDNIIGEPFTKYLSSSFPIEIVQDNSNFFSFFMGFPIYDCIMVKGGQIVALTKEANDNDEKEIIAAVCLREFDPKKEKLKKELNIFSSIYQSWGYLKAYMSMRPIQQSIDSRVIELFENSKYKTNVKQFESRMNGAEKSMITNHKQYGPNKKHWYIVHVGVHPNYQNQGYGKQVMNKVHEMADSRCNNNMDCYLETCGERNIHFYEKLGYQVVCNIHMQDSDTTGEGLDGVAMVRYAKI